MLYDTEKKLTLYTLFLHEFEKIDQIYNINTYNWTTLPSQISGIWMPYSMMLDEFACELANSINALMLDIQRLSAWAKIIPTLDDDHKMLAAHEFINSIGTNALLSPFHRSLARC